MRFPLRRTRARVPAEVARALPLEHGEAVLAAAQDTDGHWYLGTARALLLPHDDGWRRLPWETIERATWDRDSEQLVVVETADFGEVQPTYRATLPDPGRLLQLVRERITASIVIKVFEPVQGKRGITVSGRRAPHSDDPPVWSVLVDPGLDENSEAVLSAARNAVAVAQSQLGL